MFMAFLKGNEEVKHQVANAFDRFFAMQTKHCTCLTAGCLTEIAQWNQERQAIVDLLFQTLSGLHTANLDPELRTLMLEKIRYLLSKEKMLLTIAEQQRTTLSEKITVIRRGRRTLGCYGSANKNLPPQFVSDKG